MDVYLFSNHSPVPEMIEGLGGKITEQFRGNITDIHRQDKQIVFTETLFIGGDKIKACHTIPAESIVVIEAPPLLQSAWLDSGVFTLLIPQMEQETRAWGGVVFKYRGLIQVHKIEVVTSRWTNSNINVDGSGGQPTATHEPKPEQTTPPERQTQMPNLFKRLGRNSSQRIASH